MGTDMRAYFGRLSRHRCYIHGAAVHRQVSARRPAPRSPGTRLAEVVTHPLRAAPTRLGATLRRKRESDSLDGTPPRAWGQRFYAKYNMAALRYTPTRVGTTCAHPPGHPGRPVHPHARGDDSPSRITCRACSGTPPRAWGRPFLPAGGAGVKRYTPTRVGTT